MNARISILEIHQAKGREISRNRRSLTAGKRGSSNFSPLSSTTICLLVLNHPNHLYFFHYHRRTKIMSSFQPFSSLNLLFASSTRSDACLLLSQISRETGPPRRFNYSGSSSRKPRILRSCNGSSFAISYLSFHQGSSSGRMIDAVRCGQTTSTLRLSTNTGL